MNEAVVCRECASCLKPCSQGVKYQKQALLHAEYIKGGILPSVSVTYSL